jgi:hypothetical protein
MQRQVESRRKSPMARRKPIFYSAFVEGKMDVPKGRDAKIKLSDFNPLQRIVLFVSKQ